MSLCCWPAVEWISIAAAGRKSSTPSAAGRNSPLPWPDIPTRQFATTRGSTSACSIWACRCCGTISCSGSSTLRVRFGTLDRAKARLQTWMLGIAALLAGFAIALAWYTAASLTVPLDQIAQRSFERFTQGQWTTRVTVPDARETGELAEAFNRMADELQQKIAVLTRHNNEQKAVLASMAEGVLAVDSQQRIISLNRASGRLLGLDQAQVQGRRLHEVVRNADLQPLRHRRAREPGTDSSRRGAAG